MDWIVKWVMVFYTCFLNISTVMWSVWTSQIYVMSYFILFLLCFVLQTYIGDILVAFNPYKQVHLYGPEVSIYYIWFSWMISWCILFLVFHFYKLYYNQCCLCVRYVNGTKMLKFVIHCRLTYIVYRTVLTKPCVIQGTHSVVLLAESLVQVIFYYIWWIFFRKPVFVNYKYYAILSAYFFKQNSCKMEHQQFQKIILF